MNALLRLETRRRAERASGRYVEARFSLRTGRVDVTLSTRGLLQLGVVNQASGAGTEVCSSCSPGRGSTADSPNRHR